MRTTLQGAYLLHVERIYFTAGMCGSNTFCEMVQVAKRQGYKLLNLWTTDKATFPVVFCASFAAVAAAGVSLRYIFANPDVYFNKEERFTELHHTLEPRDGRGSAWRQFRFRMANLQRNPINQSRQFDDLFAKEENQNVKR